jgi:hypothetical protein
MRAPMLAFLALSLLLPARTGAQEARWRFDVQAGGFFPLSDVDFRVRELIVPTENFKRYGSEFDKAATGRFDPGGTFAIGAGYKLNDYVELGAQFQEAFTEHVSSGTFGYLDGRRFPLNLPADSHFDVYDVTAGCRLYAGPPWHRVRPWLVAQMGWYRANGRVTESCYHHYAGCGRYLDRDSDSGFGVNVGGGFDVYLARHVSLGLDVRYHNAIDVLGGFDFVTTMAGLTLHVP